MRRYGEDSEGEDIPLRDRPYESFGQQGFGLPDHPPVPWSPDDDRRFDDVHQGAERVDLGEPIAAPVAARTETEPLDDERVADRVLARLADDAWVDPSAIEVVVDAGRVHLGGSVGDIEQRRRAAELASSVFGVVEVVNLLRVEAAR